MFLSFLVYTKIRSFLWGEYHIDTINHTNIWHVLTDQGEEILKKRWYPVSKNAPPSPLPPLPLHKYGLKRQMHQSSQAWVSQNGGENSRLVFNCDKDNLSSPKPKDILAPPREFVQKDNPCCSKVRYRVASAAKKIVNLHSFESWLVSKGLGRLPSLSPAQGVQMASGRLEAAVRWNVNSCGNQNQGETVTLQLADHHQCHQNNFNHHHNLCNTVVTQDYVGNSLPPILELWSTKLFIWLF